LEYPDVLLEIETLRSPGCTTSSVVNGLLTIISEEEGVTGGTVSSPSWLSKLHSVHIVIDITGVLLFGDKGIHVITMFEALDLLISVHVSSGLFLGCAELFKRKFFLPSAEERVVVSVSVVSGVFVSL